MRRGHGRQRALKGSSNLEKLWGRKVGTSVPFCLDPLCQIKVSEHSQEGSKRDFYTILKPGSSDSYVTNQFKATSPLGNLQNTTETLFTKVARNVFLFRPPSGGEEEAEEGSPPGGCPEAGPSSSLRLSQSMSALPCPALSPPYCGLPLTIT